MKLPESSTLYFLFSGHMVPMDQPKHALDMITRFTRAEKLAPEVAPQQQAAGPAMVLQPQPLILDVDRVKETVEPATLAPQPLILDIDRVRETVEPETLRGHAQRSEVAGAHDAKARGAHGRHEHSGKHKMRSSFGRAGREFAEQQQQQQQV